MQVPCCLTTSLSKVTPSPCEKTSTDAEVALWMILRDRRFAGLKFRRQHPIGPYILDFFCPALRLAIEADGGQHYTAEGMASDDERTSFLNDGGIEVLRFSNRAILTEREGVTAAIEQAIGRAGSR